MISRTSPQTKPMIPAMFSRQEIQPLEQKALKLGKQKPLTNVSTIGLPMGLFRTPNCAAPLNGAAAKMSKMRITKAACISTVMLSIQTAKKQIIDKTTQTIAVIMLITFSIQLGMVKMFII
uniref:Uncharacterized protein n=1 Tax=Spironucleus salmonicida TaxID=348837 RepID=V6LFA7_9EUKA|eukprot:EST43210.1 Hypothetical protein SS50377_17154 [Spironucleus salmonicida]